MPEQRLLGRAIDLVRQRRVGAESGLASIGASPGASDAAVLERLRRIHEAGGRGLVESAVADLPSDLRRLYESGAVTLEQLGIIHRALDATSAADLARAVRLQALRRLAGVGESVEAAVAAALPGLRDAVPAVPLGRAAAIVEPLLDRLRALPGVLWAEPTGSLRRGADMVGDLEILAATREPGAAIEALLDAAAVRCLHRGPRRAHLLIERVQVGVVLPDPSHAGSELLYRTGSARHLERLRTRAAGRGLSLDADAATEEDLYGALGLPWIPPEIRNGDDEVRAAERGALPALVAPRDIRGDLHMHSSWSDGRDSIASMVMACEALGYEYLAITDHSQTSAASRNLTLDGVKQQADEIARLRERHAGIAILHGCEVDILVDGRLDFPDPVLERFDIVLASLHEGAGHSPQRLLTRYAAALKHPLVTLVTHPTNRTVGHRPGYELDYDRLFALAADTGTAVEIDGAPSHIDLDGPLARRAISAGATVAVDSDCHRADMLGRQMHLGIVTARRGWVEPRHVLNTRSLADVRHFIAAKRSAR